MPELPEAETIARGLHPILTGRVIREVEVVHRDLLVQAPTDFALALRDRVIAGVGRRGKNVLLHLADGPTSPRSGARPRPSTHGSGSPHRPGPAGTVVVNLGMTGRLEPDPEGTPSYLGVRFHLDRGSLVYRDVRRFGELVHRPPPDFRRWSARLGPEPLSRSFTARRLGEAITRSRSPVRSWLLDQRRVAGVGNIYAVEALHRAGIHPARPGASLSPKSVRRLHRGLRSVLRSAIRNGGTTLRDYRAADGSLGNHGPDLRVYGRAGLPCTTCGTPVQRIVFGNRSAFLCPTCQPAPAEGSPATPRAAS